MRVRGTQGAGVPETREWPAEWGLGFADRDALNQVFSVAYEELRRLASTVRRSDPHASLSPTTLVNEAWLKLAGSPRLAWASPLHFKRIAARAMRQLLIEAARRRNALKRGGVGVMMVTFDEPLAAVTRAEAGWDEEELLRLDGALEELGRLSPRQATIVESRFFGGLDVADTAQVLGISEATVARDWRAAKAWLGRELSKAS
jgi:RNA polymerase sigma factor (TIGR02999 family)